MQFHLPKPLHGWRAFVGEVGIIVLGVLIALGLGQLVESIHDRSIAAQARDAINAEMQANLDRVAYRLRQQHCVEKRLDEVQQLLADWQSNDAFSSGLQIGFPGDAGIVDQRWQANLASGRFSEQASDVQSDQAGLYTLIHVIDSIENREIEYWSQLRALELGSQSISLGSKPMIAAALAHARSDGEAIARLSPALLGYLRTAGPGRPALIPKGDFVPAFPGTACEPMRKAA